MHILVSYSVFSITGRHYSHGSRVFLGAKIRVEGDYKYCSLCHRNLVSFDDSGNTLICPTCGRKQEIKPVTADDNSGGLKQKNPPISKRNSFVISQQDKNKKQQQDKRDELQQIVGRGGFITDVEEIEL
jgi:uncharacterized Zn finger protein (UPF0148 family)